MKNERNGQQSDRIVLFALQETSQSVRREPCVTFLLYVENYTLIDRKRDEP